MVEAQSAGGEQQQHALAAFGPLELSAGFLDFRVYGLVVLLLRGRRGGCTQTQGEGQIEGRAPGLAESDRETKRAPFRISPLTTISFKSNYLPQSEWWLLLWHLKQRLDGYCLTTSMPSFNKILTEISGRRSFSSRKNIIV